MSEVQRVMRHYAVRVNEYTPSSDVASRPKRSRNRHACQRTEGSLTNRFSIANEIDMIQVRRTAEYDPFEVVVREGKGETRHHVMMSREMCERLTAGKAYAGTLSRGGLPVLA
jgi:hypothetical protein